MTAIYADVHVPLALVNALRKKGYDVLCVSEDDRRMEPDEALLMRACALGRFMLTLDLDFELIGRRWQSEGRHFPAVMRITDDQRSPQFLADEIEIYLVCGHPHETRSQVRHIPLTSGG
jgi:hypothetical protein